MNPTELILSLALMSLLLRQIRPRPLNLPILLYPIPLVMVAAYLNLHTLPSGPSLSFALLGGTAGLLLGAGCGLTTQVYKGQAGQILAHASGIAALLWIVGVGSRIGFGLYAEHGGGPTIAQFSTQHHLTQAAWITAMLLMALLEVVGRSGVLIWRWQHEKQNKAVLPALG